METPEAIVEKQRKLNKLERQLALQKIKQHKAQMSHQIELGGLMIKAQLNQYPKPVILGALLEIVEHLEKDIDLKTHYQQKGEVALMELNEKESELCN